MSIGNRLDQAMKAARIKSQSELSRVSGVPQATISRILKGTGAKGPETETIKKLARACKVSFAWLNEGEDSSAGNHETAFLPDSPFMIAGLFSDGELTIAVNGECIRLNTVQRRQLYAYLYKIRNLT